MINGLKSSLAIGEILILLSKPHVIINTFENVEMSFITLYLQVSSFFITIKVTRSNSLINSKLIILNIECNQLFT